MTTVLLLLLGYAVATVMFVRWARRHAPEGYEDESRGFIVIEQPPDTEAKKARHTVEDKRWAGRQHGEAALRGSLKSG